MAIPIDNFNNHFPKVPLDTAQASSPKQGNWDEALSKRVLDILCSGKITSHRKKLINDFNLITPEQLKEVLSTYFKKETENLKGDHPFKSLNTLAEIIPYEKLEKALCEGGKTALTLAKTLLNQAKYYLENGVSKVSTPLKTKIANFIDALRNFIDSILEAFGIAELFKTSKTFMESQSKQNKIQMLVGFSSMLTQMLLPSVGIIVAGPIIGGIFLIIGVLSLIYPHISAVPSELPHATNWTKLCSQNKLGDLSLVKGRKDILDEMANSLIKNQKGDLKKHPLLLGKSRVGKTQTAKAFVYAIERGDYPELKGKKVFYLNTAKLLKMADFASGNDPLEQISEKMGRHRNNIVLVLDEIHVAFQGGKNAVLSQKLKDMIDSNGEFPHVIGITTSEEFLTHISKDQAFANRFNPITLGNTSPEATIEILSHHVVSKGKEVLCEKGALKMIYEKTNKNDHPQPYSARVILDECIARTSEIQKSKLKTQVQECEIKKEFLASQAASSPLDIYGQDEIQIEIEKIEEQILYLKEEIDKEASELQHLFNSKKKISETKLKAYQSIIEISKISGKILTQKNKIQLNNFLLTSRLLSPILEQYVKDESKRLGLKVVIDESVIDEAIKAQETTELKKTQSMQKANEEKKAMEELFK